MYTVWNVWDDGLPHGIINYIDTKKTISELEQWTNSQSMNQCVNKEDCQTL
jgi:hypothetical protein